MVESAHPGEIFVREANLQDEHDLQLVVDLSNAYAKDPMGLGHPLSDEIRDKLPKAIREVQGALVFIAYLRGDANLGQTENRDTEGQVPMDDSHGKPVGIATCFTGFSTFKAAPLINIHDIAVLPEARGKGVGAALLESVKKKGRETGCCKVTLEVREDNAARRLYERSGFEYGEPEMYFMTCDLSGGES